MIDLVKKFFRRFTCQDDPIKAQRRVMIFLQKARERRSYAVYIEFPEGNKIYDIVSCEDFDSIVNQDLFDITEEELKAYIIEPTIKEG